MAKKDEMKEEKSEMKKGPAEKQTSSRTVKAGDKVAVHYVGRTEGIIFDSSRESAPIEFKVGSHEVIRGFEDAVIGMSPGQKKTIKIPPEQSYGEHVDKMVVAVPRQTIRIDAELKPGQRLEMTLPDGSRRVLTIVKVEGDAITIDLNHPLAGKTLEFEIEIMAVNN